MTAPSAREVMPALLLLPFTGSVADRFDRRRVAMIAFLLEIGVSLLLFVYATTDPTSAASIFGLAALFGVVRAFGTPAMRSIPPLIAPLTIAVSETEPSGAAQRSIARKR